MQRITLKEIKSLREQNYFKYVLDEADKPFPVIGTANMKKDSCLVFPIETITVTNGLVSTKSVGNSDTPQLSLVVENDNIFLGYAYANKDYAIQVDFQVIKEFIPRQFLELTKYECYSVDTAKVVSALPVRLD